MRNFINWSFEESFFHRWTITFERVTINDVQLLKNHLWVLCLFNDVFSVSSLQCHQTRSVDINRKRAREIMREKLDVLHKGELSEVIVKKRESELRKQDKRKKVNENLERKRLFKEALAADPKPENGVKSDRGEWRHWMGPLWSAQQNNSFVFSTMYALLNINNK